MSIDSERARTAWRPDAGPASGTDLRVRCLDLDTRDRAVALLREDSALCRAEGFAAHARVMLESAHGDVIATLYQTRSGLLAADEVGLSDSAWKTLQVRDGDRVHVRHPRPLRSSHHVRAKVHGQRFEPDALDCLRRVGIERVACTDSVPSDPARIELAPSLAPVVRRCLETPA